MSMTIPAGGLRSAHRPALLDAVRGAWHAYLERRAQRLALRHLDPRLLADMGIDPATVRSVSGGWEELMLNSLLMRSPRR